MVTNFQEHYSQLGDEELLLIAGDRESLGDEARVALDAEMAKRKLTLARARAVKRQQDHFLAREKKSSNVFRSRPSRSQLRFGDYVAMFCVFFFFVAVAAAYKAYTPAQFRLSEVWEDAAVIVIFGFSTTVAIFRELWKRADFWLALILSTTAQAFVAHGWIVHYGNPRRGTLLVFLNPVGCIVLYGAGRWLRARKGERANWVG